jgi:type 1 glutamine amidotransferase
MKKIITVLGDASHNHDQLLRGFREIIVGQMPEYGIEDLTVDYLGKALQTKPSLVVISKMNPFTNADGQKENWLTDALEDQLLSYVEQGGSILAWHSGLYGYNAEGKYGNMIGGHFRHRPPNPLPVRYTTIENTPITATAQEIEIQDEHFLMECDLSRVHVFMNSVSEGGAAPAGWYREAGEGKVCCITAPHPTETAKSLALNQVIYQCVLWCTKK